MFDRSSDVRELPSLIDEPQLYPDGRPVRDRTDFGYRSGTVYRLRSPLDAAAIDAWLRETGAAGLGQRIALLAVGSNAYPRQLHDKLTGSLDDAEGLVVVRARVSGCGVAYCPIRARKGYVPVTLASRPRATLRTWLQWLTPGQLQLIGATEGPRYALAGGRPLAARVSIDPQLPRPDTVYAWWFDSTLIAGQRPLWLEDRSQADVWRECDGLASAPQRPPADWTIVNRSEPDWATRMARM